MYKTGQLLRTEADFDNAMFFDLPVEVWWKGQKYDTGGKVCEHTPMSVSLGDRYYPKKHCEFRVK